MFWLSTFFSPFLHVYQLQLLIVSIEMNKLDTMTTNVVYRIRFATVDWLICLNDLLLMIESFCWHFVDQKVMLCFWLYWQATVEVIEHLFVVVLYLFVASLVDT